MTFVSKYESFWCSGFQWMSLWRSDKFLLTLSLYLMINLSIYGYSNISLWVYLSTLSKYMALPYWSDGDVPLDRVYDIPVITIDTGYLNRPNWLPIGYWLATPFITGLLPSRVPSPQCLCQARDLGTSDVRAGRNIFFNECMMIHSRI